MRRTAAALAALVVLSGCGTTHWKGVGEVVGRSVEPAYTTAGYYVPGHSNTSCSGTGSSYRCSTSYTSGYFVPPVYHPPVYHLAVKDTKGVVHDTWPDQQHYTACADGMWLDNSHSPVVCTTNYPGK